MAGGDASHEIVWRHGILEHDGEEIYYEEAGEGDAVVLCHGLGGNHAVWYQQVAHFAPSHRVITWDQRGFGRSTRRGKIGPRPGVSDLLALFDDRGVGQAHVVGQSLGGWAALGFALEHPSRLRSLVLADTLGGIFTEEIVEILTSMPRPPLPPEPPVLGIHPAIAGLADKDPAQAFLYQQIAAMGTQVDALEGVALLLQTQWSRDAVAALGVPTLFVFGDEDNLFPSEALRLAAAAIPGAEVTEIAGATHSPYFEAAAEWNEVVERFFARVTVP